jgi:TonB family protein
MTRRTSPTAWLCLSLFLFVAGSLVAGNERARAQPAPAKPSPQPPPATPAAVDPNAVTPPKLLAFVDAGYPEQARASQRDAAVLLVITISEDGFVEEVTLAGEPVGDGFDELAQAAARRFVFEPAARGGQPMRSRIQYQYEFKYQPVQVPAALPEVRAPPEARLTVTLRSSENDKPLANAEVLLSSPTDLSFARRLLTDSAGVAAVTGLAPGRYDLALSGDKLTSERHSEELPANETTEITYRLQPARDQGDEYGAIATIKAPAREVTRRTIEREVLTRVAGTRGDALRAIELLPGVGRPPFTSGLILIRGAGPSDSQVFLDGVPVPLLYHFGGLTSFINSRALDRIDFYPGNFSARYGRATGGIVDVGVREPLADKYHGVLDVNVPLDSSILLEGPITKKSSFMVGGRRSYLGDVVNAVIPKGTFGEFAAPVYNDYQAFVTYRPTDRDRLRIGGYGASDRLDVLFAKNDDDPTIKGIKVGQNFHRAQLGWKRQYSPRLEHDIQFSLGRENTVFRAPPEFNLALHFNTAYLRAEWRYRFSETLQLIVGTDSTVTQYDVKYEGPSPDSEDSSTSGDDGFSRPAQLADQRDVGYALAAFVELAIVPIKKLRIVPGLRLDYFQLTDRFAFNPRLAAIYSLNDQTKLKAGVGVFSQPPQPPYSVEGIGNPDLLWTTALHYSAGVEHRFNDDYSLGLEGFYKSIYNNIVNTDIGAAIDAGATQRPPPFDNDGIGRIYGLEVLGRKQARGRWFGFVSYTLMRSERKDHDQPFRVYNYDQTHILSLATSVKLGRGWEAGATLRVVTGNPRTPIVGASYNVTTGMYNGEEGRLNSSRNPTFNRIDLRAEKTWRFDSWRLALYLDIQNSYNAVNREAIQYSYNFKQQANVRGLPILPVLGLRGEL